MMRIGVKYDDYDRRTDAVGGGWRKSGGFLRMKRMLVAVALALVPLTTSPASAHARPSHVHAAAVAAERPQICFVFGPWKYCI
jgi:hypothetical protein